MRVLKKELAVFNAEEDTITNPASKKWRQEGEKVVLGW